MEEESKSKLLNVVLALLFLVPVALVFQQSATSLAAQGAASGNAMTNAAMFPKLLATLLGGLALAQTGISWRRGVAVPVLWTSPLRNSVAIMGILAGYLLLLPSLGYHIATPILCLLVLRLLGLRFIAAVVIGPAMSLVVALFFETGLNVILPVGMFGLALPF